MAIGSVAFFLLGLETVLMQGIAVFFILLVIVSACSGVFFALATTVIVDTFGVARLTSCFGMITMVRGLAPYATIGFMLSISQLIDTFSLRGNQLLPFRIACVFCATLVFICCILHLLLYLLRKNHVSTCQSIRGKTDGEYSNCDKLVVHFDNNEDEESKLMVHQPDQAV